MDHRTLLYFTTLIDCGTFTNAAQALHISQPSLSSAIQKIEASIGLQLIDRSTRKISLTKEGEVLYKEAKKLLHHFDQVQNEMTRLKQEGPLELQIGLIESIKSWLPKVISVYRKENPDIHFKLSEVLGARQVEHALENYQIHLAITNQHFANKDILTTPIYQESLVALLPHGHRLSQNKQITIHDIQNEPLIISRKGFQTRENIANEFRKLGLIPNIHFEIERFETASSLVAEGLGITIVPKKYIQDLHNPPFVVKTIDNDNLSRIVYIAYMKNRYLPPVVESFITTTKEHFLGEATSE